MVSATTTTPRLDRLPRQPGTRRRSHAQERGAALLIVVMVILLLTTLGIYAARGAGLVSLDAGYSRRASQALYMTELAASTMAGDVRGQEERYAASVAAGTARCRQNFPLEASTGTKGLPCARADLRSLRQSTGLSLVAANDQAYVGTLAGDSTLATSAGNFDLELTDYAPAPQAVVGSDVGGVTKGFRYMQVTMTATGLISPADSGTAGVCDPIIARGSVLRRMRARVTFGPIKSNDY